MENLRATASADTDNGYTLPTTKETLEYNNRSK